MKALLSLSLVFAVACGAAPQPAASATTATAATASDALAQIKLDELERGIADKSITVYDANSKEHFAEGHIPSAKHLAYDQITAQALPADKAAPVVFYCWNEQCSASHEAAKAAMKLGYTNVRIYAGGIEGWRKGGKSVER
jgi:rhodanese-related sulfurtransferase